MDLILWRHAEAEEDAPGGDDIQAEIRRAAMAAMSKR